MSTRTPTAIERALRDWSDRLYDGYDVELGLGSLQLLLSQAADEIAGLNQEIDNLKREMESYG